MRRTPLVHHQTINIQNGFGLTFMCFTCPSHFQCSNDFCDYMHCNTGECNNTEWAGSTPTPFSMGIVALERSKLECNICHSIVHVCIVLCYARIIYVYSTSSEMASAYIYLSVHNHYVFNGTCREYLDIAYQCVANEVTKNTYCQKLCYSNGSEQTIFGRLCSKISIKR